MFVVFECDDNIVNVLVGHDGEQTLLRLGVGFAPSFDGDPDCVFVRVYTQPLLWVAGMMQNFLND